MGEIFRTKDLELVDVRKYDGVQDGMEAWIFLGYDIVSFDAEGKAVSVVALEETKYDVLKKVFSEKFNRHYYNHSNLNVGDVRVKVVENANTKSAFIGSLPIVTKAKILEKIEEQPEFYFLHHEVIKETGKVKSLGSK